MSTSLSRFQIVEGNPPHLPNKCAVCGSINGTFIDFGLDLEFYGTVYLCLDNCIKQLSLELGFFSPSQHKTVQESEARLRKENNDLRDRLEVVENGMAALRRIDSYRDNDRNDTGNSRVADDQERSGQSASNDGAFKTEHRSGKQTSQRGFADILSDDGFIQFLGSNDS